MIIETSARVDVDVDVEIDLDDLDFDDLYEYVRSKCAGAHFPPNLAENSYKVHLAIKELSALQGEKENIVWLVESITGKVVY